MCRLRIAHPPSHIQAAQGFLVAATVARVSATVAAGNNQYTTSGRGAPNAHSRQQPRTHTSRTLERVLTASNPLDGINTHRGRETPSVARTGALAGIVRGECACIKRNGRRARRFQRPIRSLSLRASSVVHSDDAPSAYSGSPAYSVDHSRGSHRNARTSSSVTAPQITPSRM